MLVLSVTLIQSAVACTHTGEDTSVIITAILTLVSSLVWGKQNALMVEGVFCWRHGKAVQVTALLKERLLNDALVQFPFLRAQRSAFLPEFLLTVKGVAFPRAFDLFHALPRPPAQRYQLVS